jgi:leucyl aminopeptidase
MKIEARIHDITQQPAPALAVGLFKDEPIEAQTTAQALDQALAGQLTMLLDEGDFRARSHDILVHYPTPSQPIRRLILVGLGKRGDLTKETLREASALAAKKARELGVNTLHTVLHTTDRSLVSLQEGAEAVTEGAQLGLYRFREFKTQNEDMRPDPDTLILVGSDEGERDPTEAGINWGSHLASATILARNLVNRPANTATPTHVAKAATQMANKAGLTSWVLSKEDLEHEAMHMLLSVNQGGNDPARMVILEHNADRPDLPTIVLVGKGITFDTGGISLKSSRNMDRMKGDMAGAAAVIGVLSAAAHLDLPLHVVGLTPLTENMPDARATKPGDVVTSRKGLTVEIINTDAEGRLILGDALTYAGTYEPDAVIDIATLTGGRIVALGDHAAAVMGDESLIALSRSAGDRCGERVWPLPLFEAYGKQLESLVADVKNVGGRSASSITAGFFLSKFKPDDADWLHIDIAGLAIVDRERPYVPKGGTGFGARLLIEMLRTWPEEEGSND